MMAPRNTDLSGSDIAAIIQAAISPLLAKIQVLEEKVDRLGQDRVTRPDLEKLTLAFVPRDAYEPRHAALIDRDRQLEDDMRELRKDLDTQLEKLTTQGTATWQRMDTRIEANKQLIEERMKQQQEAQLSEKDRAWVRWSIVAGWGAALIAILSFILAHVKFN
jgi:hypothetical protein